MMAQIAEYLFYLRWGRDWKNQIKLKYLVVYRYKLVLLVDGNKVNPKILGTVKQYSHLSC